MTNSSGAAAAAPNAAKAVSACPSCGEKIYGAARFCPECGAKVECTSCNCPSCRIVYQGDIPNCPSCGGMTFPGTELPPAPEAPKAEYTPPEPPKAEYYQAAYRPEPQPTVNYHYETNYYGVPPQNASVSYVPKSRCNRIVALMLAIVLGVLGIHRFYVGKIGTGLLWLFTGGCFGIGWLVDIIMLLFGGFRDKYGRIV